MNNTDRLLLLPLDELIDYSGEIKKKFVGSDIEVCGIVNAKSGICSEDCKFCVQSSKYKADIERYPLKSVDEIVLAAQNAKNMGAKKFGIVTSGNRVNKYEIEQIADAISEITKRIDITVCCSLGSLPERSLRILKESGLTRYHHNIETSRQFYPNIVSTHTYDDRLETVRAAKRAGLEVCSGGIIGMGETWQDRIDMAKTLEELDIDSVPINFLIPHENTPLGTMNIISFEDAIRTVCIFRIILKDKIIKIAAGREAVLKNSQLTGFRAGANGMLIGGYLTIKGREISEDIKLIEDIKKL